MCEETQNSQAKRELELGDCIAAFAKTLCTVRPEERIEDPYCIIFNQKQIIILKMSWQIVMLGCILYGYNI